MVSVKITDVSQVADDAMSVGSDGDVMVPPKSKTIRKLGNGRLAYPSNTSGGIIANAVTGAYTGFRVGSLAENMFFKVADATNRNPFGDSDVYFYDSPEQYVSHCFRRVPYWKRNEAKVNRDRKDQLLVDNADSVVQWVLVTPGGATIESIAELEELSKSDKMRAMMVPRVNPRASVNWQAKRAAFVTRFSGAATADMDE